MPVLVDAVFGITGTDELSFAEAVVKKFVKVPLTNNQYSALVSLVHDIGENEFKNTTLLRKLNDGGYAAVSNYIPIYVTGTIKGIDQRLKRRRMERALFDKVD